LQDPDFQEARLDTGYLERLLGRPPATQAGPEGAKVAAIAAALFAVMDGTGVQADAPLANAANWKRAALREGLR